MFIIHIDNLGNISGRVLLKIPASEGSCISNVLSMVGKFLDYTKFGGIVDSEEGYLILQQN